MDKPIDPVVTPAPTTPVPDPTPASQGTTSTPEPNIPTTPVSGQLQGSQDPNLPASGVVAQKAVNGDANSSQPSQPVAAQPVGQQSFTPRKEAGAVGETKSVESVGQPNWAEADRVAKEENDEYWEKFATEIEAEKKVAELGGLEKLEKGEAVVSPQLAEEMGVKPVTPPDVAVADKSAFSVRGVSFSDGQISAGMKASTATGIRWLVEWFVLQLRKAHFHIKKTWGGVVERSL